MKLFAAKMLFYKDGATKYTFFCAVHAGNAFEAEAKVRDLYHPDSRIIKAEEIGNSLSQDELLQKFDVRVIL